MKLPHLTHAQTGSADQSTHTSVLTSAAATSQATVGVEQNHVVTDHSQLQAQNVTQFDFAAMFPALFSSQPVATQPEAAATIATQQPSPPPPVPETTSFDPHIEHTPSHDTQLSELASYFPQMYDIPSTASLNQHTLSYSQDNNVLTTPTSQAMAAVVEQEIAVLDHEEEQDAPELDHEVAGLMVDSPCSGDWTGGEMRVSPEQDSLSEQQHRHELGTTPVQLGCSRFSFDLIFILQFRLIVMTLTEGRPHHHLQTVALLLLQT